MAVSAGVWAGYQLSVTRALVGPPARRRGRAPPGPPPLPSARASFLAGSRARARGARAKPDESQQALRRAPPPLPSPPQGHKAMELYGVLHKPSVVCVDLRPEDCCVVLASDGAPPAHALLPSGPPPVEPLRPPPAGVVGGQATARERLATFLASHAREASPARPARPCAASRSQTHARVSHACARTHACAARARPCARLSRSPRLAARVAFAGVWDVMDPREVVNRAMDAISGGLGAAAAARQLVEDAVALAEGSPSGDADNTSAVVIALPLAG
jgi:hypothetical protein